MALVAIPDEFDFSTEFPTWIIAYCPDTNSWFCTNKRFFYFEYPEEFHCENEAVEFFHTHVPMFMGFQRELYPKVTDTIFLENTRQQYIVD